MQFKYEILDEYIYKIFLYIIILTTLILPRNLIIELLKIRPEDLTLLASIIYLSIKIHKVKEYLDGTILRWILINIIGVLSGLLSFNIFLSDIAIYLFYLKFISTLAIYILIKKNNLLIRKEINIYLLTILLIEIYQYFRLALNKSNALYGDSPAGYEDSPLATGFYYILCQLILLYVTKSINNANIYYKIGVAIVNLLILPLIALTGSKTSIIISVAIFFSIMVYNFRLKKIISILFSFFLIIIISPQVVVGLSMNKVKILGASISRLMAFNYPLEVIFGRGNWFKFEWIDGVQTIYGAGYIIGHITDKLNITFGMHYDNSLLFSYLTGGFLTIILTIEFIFYIAKKMIMDKMYLEFIILVAFAFSGLGAEILNLSLSAFCFFVFLAIASIAPDKKEGY
jgi:hypothetical protein